MKPSKPKKEFKNSKPNEKSGGVKEGRSIDNQYELFCEANLSLFELYKICNDLLKIKD